MMHYYERIKWVDEYIDNVKSYIFIRDNDNLLIKIPNEAYKLDDQGFKVLRHLLSGESVYTIIDAYTNREEVARDIHYFFCDMRSVLKGCYHERQDRKSISKIPFSLSYNTLPVLSEIAVTYKCNLQCRFCYASCGCVKNSNKKELSTGELKEVLTIIREEAHVPSVSFTGGEPSIRKDLPELVAYARSIGMWTNLITNGTLLNTETVYSLKDAGLNSAQVSLEAGEKNLHDAIVQWDGAFDSTMAGLNNLIDAGIRVHTNTTINALNKGNLYSILEKIKETGLNKFSMNMLMPAGTALDNFDSIYVTYSEIGQIVLGVADYAGELGLELMWYSPTPMCIFNPVVHGLGNKGCAACDGLLSIAPDGNILPCSSYPVPMGNILDMKGDFENKWHTPPFEYFQKKKYAHQKCQVCQDLAVCNGGCPLYWQKVGYEELLNANHEVAV